MSQTDTLEILLVEDNPDHADFTLRILAETNAGSHTHWVKNGEEALDFLYRRRQWAKAPRPGLILLDINLPKVNGPTVLKHLKSDATLRSIPIVMLTTSDRQDEMLASYKAGANSYVTKPMSFKEFADRIDALRLYWTITNRPPEP